MSINIISFDLILDSARPVLMLPFILICVQFIFFYFFHYLIIVKKLLMNHCLGWGFIWVILKNRAKLIAYETGYLWEVWSPLHTPKSFFLIHYNGVLLCFMGRWLLWRVWFPSLMSSVDSVSFLLFFLKKMFPRLYLLFVYLDSKYVDI